MPNDLKFSFRFLAFSVSSSLIWFHFFVSVVISLKKIGKESKNVVENEMKLNRFASLLERSSDLFEMLPSNGLNEVEEGVENRLWPRWIYLRWARAIFQAIWGMRELEDWITTSEIMHRSIWMGFPVNQLWTRNATDNATWIRIRKPNQVSSQRLFQITSTIYRFILRQHNDVQNCQPRWKFPWKRKNDWMRRNSWSKREWATLISIAVLESMCSVLKWLLEIPAEN